MTVEHKFGVLFDKDGTLFDFQATWGAWAWGFLTDLADGDFGLRKRLADAIEFDLSNRSFLPGSIAIAGTPSQIADQLMPHLPGVSQMRLVALMNGAAATAPLMPVIELAPFLRALRQAGYVLGVVTNDAETPALAQLRDANVIDLFEFVAGCDSGFGAKPGPGQLLAFADTFGLDPKNVTMVGDSRHDLEAAQRAGMRAIGVLTGVANRTDLEPFAELVLPDIGYLLKRGLPVAVESGILPIDS